MFVKKMRDKNIEKELILCSVVELKLRNEFANGRLDKYVSVTKNEDAYVTKDRSIKLENCPRNVIDKVSFNPFKPQLNCEPHLLKFEEVDAHDIMNEEKIFFAKFFLLNFSCVADNIKGYEDIYPYVPESNIRNARYLAKENNLHGNWNNDAISHNGAWQYTSTRPENDTFSIYDHEENLVYQIYEYSIDNKTYAILPVSYFSHPKYNEPLLLFLPPKQPYSLMNIDFVIDYPSATLLLTDDYMIAKNFRHNEDYICLCNIGGNDWIEDLDIAPLKGKSVQYLIEKDCKESYISALKIAEKFKKNSLSIKFTFNEKGNFSETLKLDKFVRLAEEQNLYIPPVLDLGQHGEIDLSKLPQPKVIFENLISTTELTLIHEHQGVRTNIISSLISLAFSNGNDIFSEHWLNKAKQSKSCLVYIDTENQQQYSKTLMATANGEINNEKLQLITPIFLEQKNDESLENFQRTINKYQPKLIIFDTKIIFKDTKYFDKFMTAINYTQNLNIGIIVVIQTEKELQKLKTYDKLVDIYKHESENNKYIVESLNSVGIRQGDVFRFETAESGWMSKTEEKEVLSKVRNRNIKNIDSGIDSSMNELFGD
ncbi:hypothetical protein AAEX28_08020 [Lentisphaerota bacterium WC36G]|nr:hypothetical protein LJT99_10875 [Lentisphaerae bacterium WC36]